MNVVDEIPRNSRGKVNRARLAEECVRNPPSEMGKRTDRARDSGGTQA